jgi:hypothetical protein
MLCAMICNAWWFIVFAYLFVCFTQDLVLLKCFDATLGNIGVFYPRHGNSNNQLEFESNLKL